MRRVLVVAGSEVGHVLPHLAVAQALRERGHRVWLYAEKSAAQWARQAKLELVPGFAGLPQAMRACRTTEEFMTVVLDAAADTAQRVLEFIRRNRVDALLTNAMYAGAGLAAERARLPWASLAATPSLLHPSTRQAAHARLDLAPLRRKLGLLPTRRGSASQGISPQLHLLSWPGAFDAGRPPPSARHVGPLFWDPSGQKPPPWLRQLDPRRPWVLASTSTVPIAAAGRHRVDVVATMVRALGRLPVQGIVTLPDPRHRYTGHVPSNVRIEAFTPHAFLIPRAQAVVTHGGWGTLGRALTAAVPVCVIPGAFDQPLNAALCEQVGVGRQIAPQRLSEKRLVGALEELLEPQGTPRRRAAQLAAQMSRLGAASRSATLLLEL